MGYADGYPIVSMQSTSKGFYGECGRRGGYMEVCGIDDKVKDELYKLSSVGLCPNLSGQIMMGLVMSPPNPGDARPLTALLPLLSSTQAVASL